MKANTIIDILRFINEGIADNETGSDSFLYLDYCPYYSSNQGNDEWKILWMGKEIINSQEAEGLNSEKLQSKIIEEMFLIIDYFKAVEHDLTEEVL